jgi:hypothetical protein
MSKDQVEHYRRRAREERSAAENSASILEARARIDLAEKYEAVADACDALARPEQSEAPTD